ncbi:WD40 repeat domain-containing protein [Methanocella arvoryzae]|nr:DUF5711 family protein [Methanocella arvoryzae]
MQPEKILKAEWKRQAHGAITHVYMTPDGSYIGAASEDHDVYLMEFGGKLLWANTTGDDVAFVKVSDDGEYVVSYSKDSIISFFNKRGDQLWTYRVGRRLNALDMDPEGSLVVAGYEDCSVRALDRSGNVTWSRTFRKPVTSVCVSGSGSLFLVGTAEGRTYMFTSDGRLRWEFITNSPVVYVFTSYDGEFSYVLEMMNNTLHCLSDRGNELASSTYAGEINDLSITDDGRYLAIGFSNSQVYFTDKNLNLLWKSIVPGPVVRLKVSDDSSMVFATTATHGVYVLNKKGDQLLTFQFEDVALGLWCSSDGNYFAAGAKDTIYLFGISRYLQYIAREQVKVLKLMEADKQRALRGKEGQHIEPRPGLAGGLSNSCARCGTPILSSRTFCNYCEMLNRRGK